MRRKARLPIPLLLLFTSFAAGSPTPPHVLASTPVSPGRAGNGCVAGTRGVTGPATLMGSCARTRRSAGPAVLSPYGTMWSAAVDPQGVVYALDRASGQLLKVTPAGRLLGRWSVPPIYVPTQPPDLTGITLGPHHTLYLTDSYNYQLVTVRTNGQIIASWDTLHARDGVPFGPFGVARDAQGNLYIPNFAFSEVEKYSPSGKLLLTFGHPCPQPRGSEAMPHRCADEGHQGPGELNHPDGIAIDRAGYIYVSDHRSGRVVKFSPSGQQVAVFGPRLPDPYGTFGLTEGVAVDNEGNLYVEDGGAHRLVKLSPEGTPLAQWRTPKGYVPEGTPGMDARGNLYLTLNSATQPCLIVMLSPDLQVRSRWM